VTVVQPASSGRQGAVSGPWLVVGLGNPGPTYAATRHNAGYVVVDELVTRMGGRLRAHRSARADVLEGRLEVGGPRLVLGRGRCYMNESGGPVAALLAFYKVPVDQLVVIHDELDLPFGALRVKHGGGDNGHNGLRSIRSALGTGDYHRVRVGVGRPAGRQDPADYVLSSYSAFERRALPEQVQRAADAVEVLVAEGLTASQQRFNGG
jgi:PTH1 family peptidyl-tRNA hydrolase